MSATPGPNNAMVTASGSTWGFGRTLPYMLGISLGFAVMLVAVALGASGLLHTLPWLHDALRWTGAAHLLWLAWRIATADPDPDTTGGGCQVSRKGGGPRRRVLPRRPGLGRAPGRVAADAAPAVLIPMNVEAALRPVRAVRPGRWHGPAVATAARRDEPRNR